MNGLGDGSGDFPPNPSNTASATASPVDLPARSIALLDAIAGIDLIMFDDLDDAEARLKKGSSTCHAIGLAICAAMRSMRLTEAISQLTTYETSLLNDITAEKEASSANPKTERIYPPGSEHQLLLAVCYLIPVLVGGLHETLTENIKAFYKLRKAYLALDAIVQAGVESLAKRGLASLPPKRAGANPAEKMPGSFDDDIDLGFSDTHNSHAAEEMQSQYENLLAQGNIMGEDEEMLRDLSLDCRDRPRATKPPLKLPSPIVLRDPSDYDNFTDPVDVFVHSGASMCLGNLLLMASFLLERYSRFLYMAGFKGDRDCAIKMLWQSSRFENFNGAFSAALLLKYYNNALGVADILPSEVDAAEKGATGTVSDSLFWKLEETRSRAIMKDRSGPLEFLRNNNPAMKDDIKRNQFELALVMTYMQDWAKARDYYIQCIEIDNRSSALYYYLAACAELELYRTACLANPKNETTEAWIEYHRYYIEEYIYRCSATLGLSRGWESSFEKLIDRKLQKWVERSTTLAVRYHEVIGVSPMQEALYLLGGLNKMRPAELELAAAHLSWDRLTCSEEARGIIQAETDERALHDLCYAAVLRSLKMFDEARVTLEAVLELARSASEETTLAKYILPAAYYEMAAVIWAEKRTGTSAEMKQKISDCQSWLDKAAGREPYTLDDAIGERVRAGIDTLRWYRRQH